MEEKEEKVTNVRRTRSGKVVPTPAKAAVKPTTRRTRKKVVLMEVEVSDDDEETPQDDGGAAQNNTSTEKQDIEHKKENDNETEKNLEDKLLATPEDSNEALVVEEKSKDVSDSSEEVVQISEENVELNGSGTNSEIIQSVDDDSVTFVLNDVEMFETTETENDSSGKVEITEIETVQESLTIELDSDEEEPPKKIKKLDPEEKKVEKGQKSKQLKIDEEANESHKVELQKKIQSPEKQIAKKNKSDQEKLSKMDTDDKVEDKLEKKEIKSDTKTKAVTSTKDVKTKTEATKDVEARVEVKKDVKAKAEVTKDKEAKAEVTKDEEAKPEVIKDTDAKVEPNKDAETKVEVTKNVETKKTLTKDAETSAKVTKEAKTKAETAKDVKTKAEITKNVETNAEVTEDKSTKVDVSTVEETKANVTKDEESKAELTKDSDVNAEVTNDAETKADADVENEENGEKPDESVSRSSEPEEGKTKDKAEKSSDEKNENKEVEEKSKDVDTKHNGDPDAENISEDELPGVPVVKVPEAEEVSDEELPGPKRAELPADTEVVSEDELPSVKGEVKKEGVKRKLDEGDYDPGSPTSENEAPTKKPSLEAAAEKEKEEKPAKPKKLPELDKYWKAVNDDPTDFTGWTYLLQYVDQENDMEAAREAYDAFLSHYPYCYGYWRKYADYEKRKGNKKKCEEVFERGLKAIPLSVDLWIHYLTYVKTTRADDEEYVRSQFERAIVACGLEFRSDRLWDSYIKWETEGKRLQRVTAIYDRLLATPTQGYTTHFDSFQEHISSNPPNKVVEVDEFLALRKEVRHMLKHDVTTDTTADDSDAPPGDEDQSKVISSDEETKSIRERIVSIRRKIHKATVNAVTSRWNYEEGIKRPYFHVKPLERCQLKNWQDYLDYETEQGDRVRIIVLFERCLIACALYEEFWMKFVHYLEGLKDPELQTKIRDVYERACTIHHLKKPNLHLQWAMFEESVGNFNRAAEILVNLEKSVPNVLQIAYRRINLERRRADFEKCSQLYEHYINNSKNKMVSSNIAIKYSRFCLRVLKDMEKAQEVLKTAMSKDPNNPRLYLQLIDLTLHKENVTEAEIIAVIDSFLDKDSTDSEQKVLFAQRKLEYLEDFGADIQSVQLAYDQYQKYIKQNKENSKKKEAKSEPSTASKKEKSATQSSSQSSSYGNYGNYSASSNQPSYPYSGSQQGQYNYSQYGQGDQYQYQNWQYPQGGYGGYNQWGSYGGGYGY